MKASVKAGFAFWLLLAPGENWTWTIVGGHDLYEACEEARGERPDGDYLVCASTPARAAVEPAATDPVEAEPKDRGPSPSLARERAPAP